MPTFDRRRPFTRAQAHAAGISDDVLRGRSFRRLTRGVYIDSGVKAALRTYVDAAFLRAPHAQFVTGRTAAALWGAVVPDDSRIWLGTARHHRNVVAGIHVRRYRREPETALHRGLHLTSPAQTFLDLATELDLVDMVVLGDSLVRRTGLTPSQLREFVADTRVPGSRLARRAAAMVRSHVDSPQETRTRMLLVLAGLPEPEINIIFRNEETGEIERRSDMGYRAARMLVEYDGEHHVTRIERWREGILRREELEARGWTFLVVTSVDLTRRPRELISRAVAMLRRGGVRVGPVRTEWERHFPVWDRSVA